jgi:three-Cys-motif partner protein
MPVRASKLWTRDKLGVIELYASGFGVACSKKSRQWYYVDGFAGCGVNEIEGTGELLAGSPLLGLEAEPAFTRCALMDSGARNVTTLKKRTAIYGDRAVVERGDANVDLLRLMHEVVNPGRPCLCLLDPEGIELDWQTIEAISRFRKGDRKVEQVILFDGDGVRRVMPLFGEPWGEPKLERFWGPAEWRPVWERRRQGRLTAEQAQTEYLRLYVEQIRGLGYAKVLNKAVRHSGHTGKVEYFLVFATDHPTGEKIMRSCFKSVREWQQAALPFGDPGRDV